MLEVEGQAGSSKSCGYLCMAVHTLVSLSKISLSIYPDPNLKNENKLYLASSLELVAPEKFQVLSQKEKVINIHNTIFLKLLFDMVLKDIDSKKGSMGWHYLLKETYKALIEIFEDSSITYIILKVSF